MGIKDILLYLDDSIACENRIDAALKLAKAQGARVTGLFIISFGYYQPHHLRKEENMARIGALLEARAQAAGVEAACRSVESRVVGVTVQEILSREAHTSDLIVIGQDPPRTPRTEALAERLITDGGRPVLLIPSSGVFPAIGTRVLVAWKSGREAARAIHDALPILKRAELVTLLAVATEEGSDNYSWTPLLDHLKQHGITPRTEIQPVSTATPADNLLNHACDGGYDLLVMGAYTPGGNRRGSQMGGVAGQILREMTLPVFMSH